MNTTEIRLTTPSRLDEALALPADAIGMGQEGCLAKLPDTDTLRAAGDRIRAAARAFVLVAPIGWPRTADQLLERLTTVARDGPTTIAVNDIGTALALAAARPADCTVVAGLGLTRARPHSGNPDDSTPPPTPVDTALLNLLAKHGITGAELDTDSTIESDDRWRIRQYTDAVPVGYGRSCPTARHHKTGPPGCQPLCDTPYTISANQRWQLVHGHREPVPAGTERPVLTIWGNAVYQPATTGPTAAYRIIDARWHTPDALAGKVTALRGETPVPAGR
ncbi:hypothetical protein O7627_33705 [Solwaraspora sp. WMMD1047]|uniref:hypothetical protein n=1 Tax=Solwaraspora sp. WMMD1047 TaxID=3016102 RepID=UPI002415AC1D|nr:hypothetical protein [Solwaraspora sp. WMMD1047]MDG4834223.1 hypothetical protein [Solwaraspora sp. WMMD1047]